MIKRKEGKLRNHFSIHSPPSFPVKHKQEPSLIHQVQAMKSDTNRANGKHEEIKKLDKIAWYWLLKWACPVVQRRSHLICMGEIVWCYCRGLITGVQRRVKQPLCQFILEPSAESNNHHQLVKLSTPSVTPIVFR